MKLHEAAAWAEKLLADRCGGSNAIHTETQLPAQMPARSAIVIALNLNCFLNCTTMRCNIMPQATML